MRSSEESKDLTLEELIDLLGSHSDFCFWFGLPDCPKCHEPHGDPECSEDLDLAYRTILDTFQKPLT